MIMKIFQHLFLYILKHFFYHSHFVVLEFVQIFHDFLFIFNPSFFIVSLPSSVRVHPFFILASLIFLLVSSEGFLFASLIFFWFLHLEPNQKNHHHHQFYCEEYQFLNLSYQRPQSYRFRA